MAKYRLSENRLRGMIREAVKSVLTETQEQNADDATFHSNIRVSSQQQLESYFRRVVLEVMERLIADYGVNEVVRKLGDALGWVKMYNTMRYAFQGEDDFYTRAQEMRGPTGN